MTKEEAITALNEGKKIRHIYFMQDEFIKMENGLMIDEGGDILDSVSFWDIRKYKFDTGWNIVE